MTRPLPTPEVLRRYHHDGFEPPLPMMGLRWLGDDQANRVWNFPEGVTLQGPPPRALGYRISRLDDDAYSVRLIWDRTALGWESLTRSEILNSSLRPLLAMLGTDLWHLLDQSVPVPASCSQGAA